MEERGEWRERERRGQSFLSSLFLLLFSLREYRKFFFYYVWLLQFSHTETTNRAVWNLEFGFHLKFCDLHLSLNRTGLNSFSTVFTSSVSHHTYKTVKHSFPETERIIYSYLNSVICQNDHTMCASKCGHNEYLNSKGSSNPPISHSYFNVHCARNQVREIDWVSQYYRITDQPELGRAQKDHEAQLLSEWPTCRSNLQLASCSKQQS